MIPRLYSSSATLLILASPVLFVRLGGMISSPSICSERFCPAYEIVRVTTGSAAPGATVRCILEGDLLEDVMVSAIGLKSRPGNTTATGD